MGVCAWLFNKQVSKNCDKNNWHERLQCAHRRHHPRTEIKFDICVINWFTEKFNWNMLDQNDILILPKKKNYLHICVYSATKQKEWKSRVVSETERVPVREPAEAAQKTNEVQKTMDKQFQTRWRETEAQLRDVYESNSAQAQQLAASLQAAKRSPRLETRTPASLRSSICTMNHCGQKGPRHTEHGTTEPFASLRGIGQQMQDKVDRAVGTEAVRSEEQVHRQAEATLRTPPEDQIGPPEERPLDEVAPAQ